MQTIRRKTVCRMTTRLMTIRRKDNSSKSQFVEMTIRRKVCIFVFKFRIIDGMVVQEQLAEQYGSSKQFLFLSI